MLPLDSRPHQTKRCISCRKEPAVSRSTTRDRLRRGAYIIHASHDTANNTTNACGTFFAADERTGRCSQPDDRDYRDRAHVVLASGHFGCAANGRRLETRNPRSGRPGGVGWSHVRGLSVRLRDRRQIRIDRDHQSEPGVVVAGRCDPWPSQHLDSQCRVRALERQTSMASSERERCRLVVSDPRAGDDQLHPVRWAIESIHRDIKRYPGGREQALQAGLHHIHQTVGKPGEWSPRWTTLPLYRPGAANRPAHRRNLPDWQHTGSTGLGSDSPSAPAIVLGI